MIEFLEEVSSFVWGPPTLILIVGAGLYLTFRLGFLQIRALPYALRLAFSPQKQDKKSKGDISHYQALTTAMAATIGTGNIVGVATAVVAGGPGAVFWMWITAIFGMATKYSEAILAVKYRVTDDNGKMAGGPMYYLERGLNLKWLGVIFAIFGSIAAFGIGNMVQSNSVSDALQTSFSIPTWVTGLVLTVLTALVVLGGIKTIGKVTSFFVPIMAVIYVFGGLTIMVMNFDLIPAAVNLILTDAFTGSAVGGGILGTVIRYGVARGVFSNEAGLGSAPIAAAAAKTDYPGRQALVSMTQVFIDTIIVCSITGITIVMADMYGTGADGASLTGASFAYFLGGFGEHIVTISIVFFAFSTLVGWSYYGEKCFGYLFKNQNAMKAYRLIFVLIVFYGAVEVIDIVWLMSDIFNALMAVPNIIGLLGLSGVVVYETKRFMKVAKEEKQQAKRTG
ncbi:MULTISPECIES: sodium:alanine symporter family protein [Oceanobacillus]|uniref:alanine/glycine:cation symporter family protein n=1 Tax=Oceanobacillus TaxID=182709 RepID=UPI00034A9D74|nr:MULTISPECIES: sodium:alanine symporter family protein [Oceanobacillus]MBT2601358.1 sodium:alanine symporter family protein [Oceanobacillus sp. ISL-74]MBT2653476.1 sodium:alanine symporter family protein [Oceanobacillus sp. ISL-73]MCT1578848.1 sodium:alanine symporter family protein [Oceanobacillus kimchii]MCT2137702.1 sodium:alanine symporter family protein [Oceanobacillus kimchii]